MYDKYMNYLTAKIIWMRVWCYNYLQNDKLDILTTLHLLHFFTESRSPQHTQDSEKSALNIEYKEWKSDILNQSITLMNWKLFTQKYNKSQTATIHLTKQFRGIISSIIWSIHAWFRYFWIPKLHSVNFRYVLIIYFWKAIFILKISF